MEIQKTRWGLPPTSSVGTQNKMDWIERAARPRPGDCVDSDDDVTVDGTTTFERKIVVSFLSQPSRREKKISKRTSLGEREIWSFTWVYHRGSRKQLREKSRRTSRHYLDHWVILEAAPFRVSEDVTGRADTHNYSCSLWFVGKRSISMFNNGTINREILVFFKRKWSFP